VSVAAPEVPNTWDEKSPIAISVVSSIEKDFKTPAASSKSSVYLTPTSKFELEDHPIDISTKLRVSHYIPPSLRFRFLTPLSTGCSNRSRPLWHYRRYLTPSKSSWYRTSNIRQERRRWGNLVREYIPRRAVRYSRKRIPSNLRTQHTMVGRVRTRSGDSRLLARCCEKIQRPPVSQITAQDSWCDVG